MSIHISILGSAVLYDVMRMNRGKGEYEINAMVSNCNPLSLVMASPLKKQADARFEEIFAAQPRFHGRCAVQDAEKSVFRYLAENRSDWLLVDFAELRWDLCANDQGGLTCRYTKEIEQLQEEGYLEEMRTLSTASLGTEKILAGVDMFLARLVKLYPEQKIVLFDTRGAERMVNENTGRSVYFDKQEIAGINRVSKLAFDHALRCLPRAHAVPFPEEIPADYAHKWGRSPLRYVSDYYEYAFDALQLITAEDKLPEQERAMIEELNNRYNAKLREKYQDYDRNKIDQLNRELNVYKRYKSYEQYFRAILIKDRRGEITAFFTRPEMKCALWGLNENSKLYLDLLGEGCGNIAYIIGSSKETEYHGVPVFPEGAETYPEVDCLVIAELGAGKIRQKAEKLPFWKAILDYEQLLTENSDSKEE